MKRIQLLLLVISLIISCKSIPNTKVTEDEVWRLGWRMIENSWDEKNEIAELQFDSLLTINKEMDRKFLLSGLMIKWILGKKEEIIAILNKQSEEVLKQICTGKVLSGFEPCNGLSEEKVGNKLLQMELIKMYVDDQAVRRNLMKNIIIKYDLDTTQITQDSGVIVDGRNRNRLKEIISEFGFPNRKMVGRDAMQGIFMMIQHSDRNKEWQKSQLENIEQAVKNGDLDGQSYAYLYDRIKINNGEKQLYGTQFANVDPVNKIAELADTEDIKNLDKRRLKIGLMPIETYKKFMLRNL